MAHVPEGRRVFADMSVYENLLLGAYTRKDKAEIAESLASVYKRFPRLEERKGQRAGTLSGGEQQRVAIAIALANEPKLLLADEPTSMIDACSRATILDMLLKLRDEINMTIIFITHDIGLAYYVSDNVYIMEHGKFVESGPAEEVILHPTAAYTKRLISDVPKIYEPWDLTTV